jgi:uncharacterized SAM-dependent methyltransferase
MPAYVPITIHRSQWPATLTTQLRASLQRRRINHKFHYESARQVRQWLRLHEAHSPARQEADFAATYEPAFKAVLARSRRDPIHLIGLGCGGGQKEAALLGRMTAGGRRVVFSATDVSSGMVLTALQAAWDRVEPSQCSGLVCDLTEADALDGFLDPQTPEGARRVVTFFGMIPNFEPDTVQCLLLRVLRPGDLLLGSANIAPGSDYRRGVKHVVPQYDNTLTREWLGLLLDDVGIGRGSGRMLFGIEESPPHSGLLRIEAAWEFDRGTTAVIEGERFEFEAGCRLQLFFSYRHTVNTLEKLLARSSLRMQSSWLSDSGEEGVFLAQVEGA